MPIETARTNAEKYWGSYFRYLLAEDQKMNTEILLEIAKRYKPAATFCEYDEEMFNRHMYLRAAMQSDMKEIIKRRFKNTWPKIIKEQANLRIYQAEIDEKSKVFVESSAFHLVDEKGEPVEDPNFDDMLKRANVHSAFKTVNKFIKSMHRAMFKPWWNKKHEHVSIGVWAPYMVNIVPNIDPAAEWWDVDQARAVLFRRMAPEGVLSTNYRQEVWGILPDEIAQDLGRTATHYITGPDGDYQVNENDENPYKDPRNDNEPIYPFVWFKDSDETELFAIGEEDALTTNRMVNSLLTDLVHTTHIKAFPPAIHTAGNDNKDMTTEAIHAGSILQLAQGATLNFPTSNLPIEEVWNFLKAYLEASGRLGKLSASVIQTNVNSEESGRALKIRERQLIEDRENLIGIIHPDVEEAVYRAALVHNTHCEPSKKIKSLEKYRVKWEPGEMDFPVDPKAALDEAEQRIRMNFDTLVSIRMKDTKEDKKTAEAAILDIITTNKKLKELSAPPPMFELASAKFDQAKQAGDEPDDDAKPKDPEANPGDGDADKTKPPAKAPPPPPPKAGEPEPEKDKPEPDKDTVEKAGMDYNLYQIALAIDRGAATAADMYMLLNPGVERAEAEKAVLANIAFNNRLAAVLAKAKAIEAAEMAKAEKKKPKPKE